jgi:hypothetical protein
VPGLILEADMCDTRLYADEPIKNRVQAFLDLLEAASLAGKASISDGVPPQEAG